MLHLLDERCLWMNEGKGKDDGRFLGCCNSYSRFTLFRFKIFGTPVHSPTNHFLKNGDRSVLTTVSPSVGGIISNFTLDLE